MKRQLRSRSWPRSSMQRMCRLTKTFKRLKTVKKIYKRMKVNQTRKASLNSLNRNGDCASLPFVNGSWIRAFSGPNTSTSRKKWIDASNKRTLSASSTTETRCWGVESRKSSRWGSRLKKSHASSAWYKTASRPCSLISKIFLRIRSTYEVLHLSILIVPLSCTNSASTA